MTPATSSSPTPGRDLMVKMAGALVHDCNIAAQLLLGEAQRRAPIEEGTLRASGEVALIVNGRRYQGAGALGEATASAEAIARAGTKLVVDAEVSFNTVYAARQHEELDWNHPKGGEAKYLERPLHELAPRLEGLIAAGQRRAVQ